MRSEYDAIEMPCTDVADIKKKHFEEIDSFSTGHFNYIAKQVVTEVIKNTTESSQHSSEYVSEYIKDAIDFLMDLRRDAINRLADFGKEGLDRYSTLYDDRDWAEAIDYWKVKQYNFTAISIGDIESMMFRYLNEKWSSETIEWLMINALLKQDIYEDAEHYIKRYTTFGQRLSLSLAGENKSTYFWLNLFIHHMRFDWITYIAISVYFFRNAFAALDNHPISSWIPICIGGLFVINRLLAIPSEIIQGKIFDKKIQKKMDLKQFTSHLIWSPSTLKRKLEKLNTNETFYPSFIPLIESMIQRNPNIFNVEGGNKFYQYHHEVIKEIQTNDKSLDPQAPIAENQ